jgi:hypothetical protein
MRSIIAGVLLAAWCVVSFPVDAVAAKRRGGKVVRAAAKVPLRVVRVVRSGCG